MVMAHIIYAVVSNHHELHKVPIARLAYVGCVSFYPNQLPEWTSKYKIVPWLSTKKYSNHHGISHRFGWSSPFENRMVLGGYGSYRHK